MLPVIFAVCCVLAALWLRRKRRGSIRHPVYTEAVVVSKVTQTGYRHRSMVEQSAPVVQYMTEKGQQTVTCRNYVPEWQYSYRMGDRIQICYEKDRPGIIQICNNRNDVLLSDLLIVIGIGTLVAYAVLWLQYY